MIDQTLLKDLPHENNLEIIAHLLRVTDMELKQSRKPNGRPYLAMTLADASTSIRGCKKWDSSEEEFNRLRTEKILFVTGKTNIYNDKLGIVAQTLAPPEPGTDVDFLMDSLTPKTTYNVKALKKGIWDMIQEMEDPWIKILCESIIKDPAISDRFSQVPAAVNYHHAFKHGLLEHTYRLMILAKDFVDSYNRHSWPGNNILLNKDAILAGCLFHDMMKCREYTVDGGYDVEGNLLGHIARGIMEMGTKTAQIEGFPEETRDLLAHCISAHHLKPDWGSPDMPTCPEAVVVHYLDDMCAKLDPTIAALNKLEVGEKWTPDKVMALGKRAYIGKCLRKET